MELQERLVCDRPLPLMLTMLCEGVLAHGGRSAEGIFRVPADPELASRLKVALERGVAELPADCDNPHTIGSVLKLVCLSLCLGVFVG